MGQNDILTMQKLKKFILQQSSEPGFTLIELILTILLIGIFTAIAMIRTQTGLTNIQEQIAIDQITSDIDLARSMAFAKHETIKIVFDTSNESYTIYTDASGTFTTISDFPNSDNGVISFNSPMLNSVDIEDVDTIYNRACTLIENKELRSQFINSGLKTVINYDWLNIANQYYEEIYKTRLM